MSSKSQTNANRTNAKESTNPRTGYPLGQGKARSSRNSTVHGLTGKSPILPGENPADLLDLAGRYRTGLHPDGQVEEDLVERIAIATYRLRRIARIKSRLLRPAQSVADEPPLCRRAAARSPAGPPAPQPAPVLPAAPAAYRRPCTAPSAARCRAT